ncbi:LOW QUALITY PROTEIN: probable phirv2 prophage integrase, partial [Mycobacterium tuberculosis T46]
ARLLRGTGDDSDANRQASETQIRSHPTVQLRPLASQLHRPRRPRVHRPKTFNAKIDAKHGSRPPPRNRPTLWSPGIGSG